MKNQCSHDLSEIVANYLISSSPFAQKIESLLLVLDLKIL